MLTIHVKAYNVKDDIVEIIGKTGSFAIEAAATGTELVDEMCVQFSFVRGTQDQWGKIEVGFDAPDGDEQAHKVGTVTSFPLATLIDRLTSGHKDRKTKLVQRAKTAASARWAAKAAATKEAN